MVYGITITNKRNPYRVLRTFIATLLIYQLYMCIAGLEKAFGHRTKTGQFTLNPNNESFVRTI